MQQTNLLKRIACDTRGATAIEYGLIVALIVIACMGALQLVAGETIELWGRVSSEVTRERG
ncbi:Flp family type IVb pilin [Pelagerythrobacter aerophilus]|uniref:Flp family type IVb pilin n=1 Tax=Pelagerythrobacter aerophilus TaxID=2306995 RepID=A0A418NKC9_9SPHN|nr:Flp family type IVb pilin [Pelagerythrobacter aerophilus]RIV79796.1 Flp family type IVb pilin [Pelagerythrobacter aerophilus]